MSLKPYIAEFLGTFTLVFVAIGAIAADKITGGQSGLVGIAIAYGLAVAVMVSATTAISGGHLNPAVTLGAWVGRQIKLPVAVAYVFSQCFGAYAAALAVNFALPGGALSDVHYGVPMLGKGVPPPMGMVMETILTFLLVFVVFGTAVDRRTPKIGGLFIGLVVMMGVLVGGPVTGAAMNPARHFGPALFNGNLDHSSVYWLGALLGGAIAGFVYHFEFEERQ
jgi:aquaporin TIP